MIGNSVWVTWPVIGKMFGGIGLIVSLGMLAVDREELMENNLYDLESEEYYANSISCSDDDLKARTLDGTCVIPENPKEGSIYTNFGRNVDPRASVTELESERLLEPNPREISNLLMGRDSFKPATSLNFIAAAWIQFMTHDWFSHGVNLESDPIEVPVPTNDPEFSAGSMIEIKRTRPATLVQDFQVFDEDTGQVKRIPLEKALPAYENLVTHWWDGSQIYGTNSEVNQLIRTFQGGKLKLDDQGYLPTGSNGVPVQGFTDNWWLGLSMLHNLFVKEHNAIAEALQEKYPQMTDQQLYDKSRLINAALMTKIHTVEWTPAIIANPTTITAMYANWWGLLGSREAKEAYRELIKKWLEAASNADGFFQRILRTNPEMAGVADLFKNAASLDYVIGGLAGATEANNYGVPYTLTEEFVQVYRMHPLMRDSIDVYDFESGSLKDSVSLEDTTFGDGEEMFRSSRQADLWFGFGITNPGALTLKNYPNVLRNIEIPFRGPLDLATIDIVRDRERGIPRYNEFRRQIGLTPISNFEQLFEGADMSLAENQQLLKDMKRVYKNDVELIDAFVGEMAESVRPEGFGFSETAFQIFIMNASRRILTDRFYTSDYNADTYTELGMDWVEGTTMVDILKRHYPELASRMNSTDNAFKPWSQPSPETCDLAVEEMDGKAIWGHVESDGRSREVVTLFNRIGEVESFYAITAEYLDPFEEDNFVSKFLRPGKRNLITGEMNGYLQELFHWITIRKIERVPGSSEFSVYPVTVQNGRIISASNPSKERFQLGCSENLAIGTEQVIEINGSQKLVSYSDLERNAPFSPLSTTWEYDYAPGPFNPGYQQGDKIILDIEDRFGPNRGRTTARFNVDELKGQDLVVQGAFTMDEAHRGLYTFTRNESSATIGAEKVEDKVGVFLDVYNAQPIFGTVELILIDPSNPIGSQMYFEEYGN
ncbi:peroxidase family protein [Pseudobacteriovorax antillogorgiicola]|uniref:Animal haem peroxidase n=1 Tax=Pseudobacteriovorax antillogorgiicola TaxID=1513793 RepID=A0A1Y6CEM1_9BACT|nr:peroxidase family protein [Pseudobacteriovorax antillogorgiicola]TCS48266.1 heme peroxidase [Pseudobacteriovorax antillogorgiicola]SMF57118.1 Animal haem peroxidase [Pseudobacteriovorax antillogorgiicola]